MKCIQLTLFIFFLLFGMMFCSSCNQEEWKEGMLTKVEIKPHVKHTLFTRSGGEQTLGEVQTSGFKMEIFDNVGKYGDTRDVFYSVTPENWSISPKAYWYEAIPMSFWSYTPMTQQCTDITPLEASSTDLSFHYPKSTVIPDGQTDLLFAYTQKSFVEGDDQNVDITFKHAMSQILFDASDLTLPAGYTLSTITLNGLRTSGDATFYPSSSPCYVWTNLSGSSNYQVTRESSVVTAESKNFIVIPQNAHDNNANIQITLTHSTELPTYLTAPLADYTMKSGLKYVYKLTRTEGRDLQLALTVLPWDLEDRMLEIKPENVSNVLSYNGVTSIIDVPNERVYVKDGQPVSGSFQLSSPKGSKLLLALDGNLDAFEVRPKTTFVDDGPVNFTITPLVSDPRIDYHTKLHVYLIASDATASELSLGGQSDYTIYLLKQ